MLRHLDTFILIIDFMWQFLFSTILINFSSVCGDELRQKDRRSTNGACLILLQVYDELLMRLKAAYGQVLSRIGDPLDKKILTGPLHSAAAVKSYQDTLSEAVKAGGTIEFGGNVSCLLSLFSMYIVLRMNAY